MEKGKNIKDLIEKSFFENLTASDIWIGFNPKYALGHQSFGYITNVHMFSRILSHDEMVGMTNCSWYPLPPGALFEWNKYNQTHYDFDNPPPKIVQGYKFNIFYPDLIDRSATPQFKLIPTGDSGDFCILKIMAGPPYEDIAFKIVNKEWEYGYKRGFRCQFHNNIFQLWFHFKRYRYRR